MAVNYIRKVNNLTEVRNLPNAAGIGSYNGGIYLNLSGTPFLVAGNPAGKIWYVDANSGSNTDDGRSWESAYLTMAKAFTSIASGDTIYFRGKIKEQLTAPVQVFDVTIIGAGNRPRHADSTPANGQLSANTWTTPDAPAAATPLLKLQQQGWRIMNVLFAGPTDAASILLFRDAGAGDAERDSSHAEIIGNRFASGQTAISDTGGCYGVLVANNRFVNQSLWSILGVGNIGLGQGNWEITGNDFDSNAVATANHVKIAGFACNIHDNSFDDGGNPGTTVVLNTNNGGGANNRVYNNHFQVTTGNFNTPDVVGATTDAWNPNYSFDTLETGTPA